VPSESFDFVCDGSYVPPMTYRNRSHYIWILLLMIAGACSRDAALSPELAGVYGRLADVREDYERGIQLIVEGDDVAGQNLLAAAVTRTTVAARECARTPGCDAELVQATAVDMARRPIIQRLDDRTAEVAPEVDAGVDPSAEDALPVSTEIEAVSLLRGASLEEVIPLNPRVLAQLNAWLTWKRPDLIEAHAHYSFLRAGMVPAYHEAGLPEALLFAMMATESGAKVHTYSRSGAAGPLQFMPATARRYGLRNVSGFDTRLDPVLATQANARYMEEHLRRLRGNLELTLAAYNAGETRLARIHRRQPEASFWDTSVYYSLPLETRTYVPRVLAAALLFLQPEHYGLRFIEQESTVTSVRLPSEASLGELAICLGNAPEEVGWFRTLRNLNPRISPADRIPAGSRIDMPTTAAAVFSTRCAGQAAWMLTARELHDADYPATPEVIHYTVRSGDSLAMIALEHRSSVQELAEMNRIRPPGYTIYPGQRLTVPARQ